MRIDHLDKPKVRATKEGKLYVTKEDFWNSPYIRAFIVKYADWGNGVIKNKI